jgi:hypothetical protein
MSEIAYSDIKKFIKKLNDRGIRITRNTKFSFSFYDEKFALIVIPKKAKRIALKNPIICLFHEGGHALTLSQRPRLAGATLNVLKSLERFKKSIRYPKVMAAVLDFINYPDNLDTLNSEKIEIIESYRKIRYTLFREMRANTEALKHIPESFKQTYNTMAAEQFKKYREELAACPYIHTRNYFKKLLELSENHTFKECQLHALCSP